MTRTARRFRILLAAGIASVVLSSCGIVGNPSQAFSVDGTSFPRKDLNGLVKALAAAQQLTVLHDVADSKDLRPVLDVLILYTGGGRLLQKLGHPVTSADRQQTAAALAPQLPAGLDPKVVELLVDINSTGAAIDKIPSPDGAVLRSLYESNPASTGFLCVREITVKSRDKAIDVVKSLQDGRNFGDLAKEASVHASTKSAGGAVEGPNGEPCMPIAALAAEKSVGAVVTRALLTTGIDASTGIVHDGSGWHVAVHRPYDEVGNYLTAAYSSKPGRILVSGLMATADIKVNSVYGTWNPVTTKVE